MIFDIFGAAKKVFVKYQKSIIAKRQTEKVASEEHILPDIQIHCFLDRTVNKSHFRLAFRATRKST